MLRLLSLDVANANLVTSRTQSFPSPNLLIFRGEQVQQRIAFFLPADDDVKNYMAACKSMNNCITDSVWRTRFLCVYDELRDADVTSYLVKSMQRSDNKWCSQFLRKYDELFGAELVDKLHTLYVQQYKFRQTISKRSISFNDRFGTEHEDCLFMLQCMVLGEFIDSH